MRIFSIICVLLLASPSTSLLASPLASSLTSPLASSPAYAVDPQATLDQYFTVLTSRDIHNLAGLMDKNSMAGLKELMDNAIRLQLARGNRDLLVRMFGENATAEQIDSATSEHYLEALATEILSAANMQHFFVDKRMILGRIDEGDTMTHYVVRLMMHQQGKGNSDILVYTLVMEDGGWKLTFPPIIRQTLLLIESMVERYRKVQGISEQEIRETT